VVEPVDETPRGFAAPELIQGPQLALGGDGGEPAAGELALGEPTVGER
jgi:hypothetical protein